MTLADVNLKRDNRVNNEMGFAQRPAFRRHLAGYQPVIIANVTMGLLGCDT
jgi:hypothetical protein